MEFFDICDEQGLPTGKTVSRSQAHELGICHRTAHIWVVRREAGRWQVLLQKRSSHKDSFPGQFDTSAAGHIQAGDEPLESGLRELQEELGISAAEKDLVFAGTFRILYDTEFYGKPFHDNETAFVYLYEKSVNEKELVLQEEEVEEVHWFDLEEIWQARQYNAQWLCVPRGGLQLLRNFLGADRDIPETLVVRPAYETDFPQLRRIYLEARKKAFSWQDTETFSLDDFDRDTCGEKILTALWQGIPAGFLTVWKPDSFIHCLFIDPAFQGRGIGKALLCRAADTFSKPLSLKCLQQNQKALAFYQSQGWKITDSGGEESHAWYRMEYNQEDNQAGKQS